MRHLHTVLLLALLLVSSSALGKKSRSRKKKEDPEVTRLLKKIEQLPDLAPGHIRWFESFRERPRIKINRLDASEAPSLKLLVTALQGDPRVTVRPIDWETVAKTEVFLAYEGEELASIASFPTEEEGLIELTRIDETGIPLDVVVIASGHSGFKDFEQLESAHRLAAATVLKEILNTNANVLWVGPTLHTFRSFDGITNELSRFDEDLHLCEVERLRERRAKHRDKEDEEEEAIAKPACGLHAGEFGGEHLAKLVEKMRFRGKHSRLFGLNRADIPRCQSAEVISTQLDLGDLDDDFAKTSDRGAFEEALLQLIRYGSPDSRKAIIILGDGKDGFIEDNEQCNEHFRVKGRCARIHEEFGRKGRRNYRKIAKKVEACVQDRLNRRATTLQERFANRAAPWLALARAANIRVYPIAYAMMRGEQSRISYAHERERLELLATKTGGTYREVAYVDWIDAAASSLVAELNDERLITVEANLESEKDYVVQVGLTIRQEIENEEDGGDKLVKQDEVRTAPVAFKAPLIESGLWFWIKQKNVWLRESVGAILYWVIIVILAILLLLILWMILKLLKAGIMKLVKAFAKKGGTAVKAGAKAAAKSGKGK